MFLQRIQLNKNYTIFTLSIVMTFLLLALFSLTANAAGTMIIESVDVDIIVNEDSTVDISETYVWRFTGEFHALYRDITLVDYINAADCQEFAEIQCGGFDFLNITSVIDDDGNKLTQLPQADYSYDNAGHLLSPPDMYSLEEQYTNTTTDLRVQWVFSEEGEFFNDETISIQINYTVYGSIGQFDDYSMLYWNALPSDRPVIKDSVVNIKFPKDIALAKGDYQVYSDHEYTFYHSYLAEDQSLKFTSELLQPEAEQTISIKIPKGIVKEAGTLEVNSSQDNLLVDFDPIKDHLIYWELGGLPPGTHDMTFHKDGWLPKIISVDIMEGETTVVDVSLRPNTATAITMGLIALGNICGCLLLPALIIWLYRFFMKNAKDKDRSKVIVPEYKIPTGIQPYLLGSIKDETVDIVDITATIIDVAYRGYIKIKEFDAKSVLGIKIQSKDYELIKLKSFTDLSATEKKIMTSFFGSKERVTTTSLKDSFYTKLPSINEKIYKEMVANGYFKESPEKIRNKYYGIGVAITIFGFTSISMNTITLAFITFSISLIIFGIIMLFTAKHMPAKTAKGSKVFDKILGFKMYLETAEKHRVQNLTPETFEKFLAYAIVFGIEKKWAEKFKSIYTTPPDWYEGSSMTNWNSLYLANALSSFRNNTASVMTSKPSSSGSYSSSGSSFSGGGWSGGGGFSGGFSGGGGGGGGAGAW